jgi:hypothetical protein
MTKKRLREAIEQIASMMDIPARPKYEIEQEIGMFHDEIKAEFREGRKLGIKLAAKRVARVCREMAPTKPGVGQLKNALHYELVSLEEE